MSARRWDNQKRRLVSIQIPGAVREIGAREGDVLTYDRRSQRLVLSRAVDHEQAAWNLFRSFMRGDAPHSLTDSLCRSAPDLSAGSLRSLKKAELLERVGMLERLLLAADTVALQRGDVLGLCDAIDNDGQSYPSQGSVEIIAEIRARYMSNRTTEDDR